MRQIAVKTLDASPLESLQHMRIEIDDQSLSEDTVVLRLFFARRELVKN
jgi:hypothetical protein